MPDPTGEPINSDDLDYLIDQYIAGQLTEADAALLLSHLEREPAAGGRLIDQLQMDAMLREVAADGALKLPTSVEPAAAVEQPVRPSVQRSGVIHRR